MVNTKSSMDTNKSLSMDAFIAEFEVLRQVIRARVDAQNRLFLFIFTVIAAVLTVAVYNQLYIVFILVPYTLIFLYLIKLEDTKTIDIVKNYIQSELGLQMRLIANNDAIIQFEKYIEDRRQSSGLNQLYLFIDLFGFCVIPLAALIVTIWGIDLSWSIITIVGTYFLWIIAFTMIVCIIIQRLKRYRQQVKKLVNKAK